MEYTAYAIGSLGFIFGIAAYTQVSSLKDKVNRLEKAIEEIKEDIKKD